MYRGIKALIPLFTGFLGVWFSARFLLPIVAPFLLGLALALASEPLVAVLNRRIRLPRSLAAGVGVSLTFCAIADQLHYTDRHVRRLHREGLAAAAALWKGEGADGLE